MDQPGVSFDAAQAQTVFDGLDWGQSQEIPLETPSRRPRWRTDHHSFIQDVLGSCTTNISGSANRVRNIQLAAQYFSGTVLMPGEEFSYNGVVGRRTAAGGFLPPPPTWAERRCRRRGAVSARALPQCIWRAAVKPGNCGTISPRLYHPLCPRWDGRHGLLWGEGLPIPKQYALPHSSGGLCVRPVFDGEYPGNQERQHHCGDDQQTVGTTGYQDGL